MWESPTHWPPGSDRPLRRSSPPTFPPSLPIETVGREMPVPGPGTSAATATMTLVPRISEFYGIVIAMYYREHGVPHFHATYAGETVVISIQTGDVIAGGVSPRALRLVQEWAEMHRDELRLNWARARENAPLVRIDPLP
jgi:hypothetical protein